MAKRNYLVEGLSGVGKSSVHDELIRRGYAAVSTDRVWSHHVDPDTGQPGEPVHHDSWMWDRETALRELGRSESSSTSAANDCSERSTSMTPSR